MALYIIGCTNSIYIYSPKGYQDSSPLISVAVAPASVYSVAPSWVTGLSPVITMTGLISDPGNSTSSDFFTILVATVWASSSSRTLLEIVLTKSSSSACEITSTWTWFTWLELVTLLSLNTSAIIVEILESVVESIVTVCIIYSIFCCSCVSYTFAIWSGFSNKISQSTKQVCFIVWFIR